MLSTDLTGTTAVVTGAGRGIGLAVVRALAGCGATVVAGTRTVTPELGAATPHALALDLASAEGPGRLVAHALDVSGGVDLLVNNVGGNPAPLGGFLATTDEDWQTVLDLNLLSTVRATRAALPSLQQRGGAIVNVASTNARLGMGPVVAYGAAKAAVLSLGKALADEFGPAGVRVNTISPGPVLTPMWTADGSPGATMTAAMGIGRDEIDARVPAALGMTTSSMVAPEEVAALVVALASDALPSMRGAELVLDGGLLKAL
ncbi:SDR family oxidoreductase [Patulibacter sp. SYSU D01012]|uniref:SDR family NAD(P)-dependent oxidoreductase n=1 Tax=Patulibacter sp. SYSU D01012 TaxID=2817381 RepID=UPI001FEE25D6|nr:SDR family oxidoreductase [Patulibacter sp. SYSU D01012]